MEKIEFTFIGQIISQNLLSSNFEILENTVDMAGNTFYTTLLEGIVDNGYKVYAESQIREDVVFSAGVDCGNINYRYVRYIENNCLRYIMHFIRGVRQINRFHKTLDETGKSGCAIFNVLRISSVVGALISCRIHRIKTVGVVTDVPGFRIQNEKKSILKKLIDKLGQIIIKRFDVYVLLSEAMTEVINLTNKPYIIIEGIYDDVVGVGTSPHLKFNNDKFNIVYAGSLHYRYGIMNLVKAVQRLNNSNMYLHIYGKGEAETELQEICNKDEKILFYGLVNREDLLKIEKEASLLVNPRPIDDSYVKYSFPSKNMEYMASGIPTLLTRISSLPVEYYDYVVLANDNSEEILSQCILEVYSNYEKYVALGGEARQFILNQKQRSVQAKKILDIIANELLF